MWIRIRMQLFVSQALGSMAAMSSASMGEAKRAW